MAVPRPWKMAPQPLFVAKVEECSHCVQTPKIDVRHIYLVSHNSDLIGEDGCADAIGAAGRGGGEPLDAGGIRPAAAALLAVGPTARRGRPGETADVSATQGQSQSEQQLHLRNLIAALSARDVQLKCKAANAVGSLCISRVAGQQLLDLHGEQILRSVAKMATCKNQWAQGDAFFVLGWMVVIADEDTLQEVAKLLPTVVKCLHRNVNLPVECSSDAEEEVGGRDAAARRSREALASSEQASNFRVYALVLLLNFSQRNVNVFEELLEKLLPMLRDLVMKLLDPAPRPISDTEKSTTASTSSTTVFDASEYAEILRLAITLLSVLVDQLETAASQLLELKALPSLLKLKRVLETPEVVELVDEAGIQDIAERLDAVIETLPIPTPPPYSYLGGNSRLTIQIHAGTRSHHVGAGRLGFHGRDDRRLQRGHVQAAAAEP
ncbi:hypothetical protein ON010_g4348 [Phytophthora cinnamomi]|nr:hypothetical protein ON010_g4348 [Phytophthora cinnamomi]